jgi:hypothetical protein
LFGKGAGSLFYKLAAKNQPTHCVRC